MNRVAGVIVAAGSSQRMGEPKQLIEVAGRPLLQWVVDAAEGSLLDRVIVVTGPGDAEIRSTIAVDRAYFVRNPDPGRGTMSSLRAGVAGAGPVDGILKLVADQPEITPADIDAVVSAWDPAHHVAARAAYVDGPGHPLLIAREMLGKVVGDGDRLLWRYLADHPDGTIDVPIAHRRPLDVNERSDVEAVRTRLTGR